MWPSPDSLHVIPAHLTLRVNRSVELGGVVGLGMQFRNGGGLNPILIRRAGNFLSRASLQDVGVITAPAVVVILLDEMRLGHSTKLARSGAVDNLTVRRS